jgi:prefoldin alpha subunit
MVELNRQKIERLTLQTEKLGKISIEHQSVIEALSALEQKGTRQTLIPFGAGVQVEAEIDVEAGAIVDIGSGVQATRPMNEVSGLLLVRKEEIDALIAAMDEEKQESEDLVGALISQYEQMAKESM